MPTSKGEYTMDSMSEVFDVRDEIKDTIEFLTAPEVAQTSVGIQAYIQARLLEKRLDKLNAVINEYDSYIEKLAEKFDNEAIV